VQYDDSDREAEVSLFHRHRSRKGGRTGQSLVEFALVFPIVIVLLLAIFDLGRLVFAYNDITNAARQGARTAIINQGGTAAVDRVIQMATSLGLTAADVDIEYAASDGSDCHDTAGKYTLACQVNVTVSFDWTPITPVIGNIVGPMTVTSTSQMPIERIFP
jgi:Flp pilus assembly protein TadG